MGSCDRILFGLDEFLWEQLVEGRGCGLQCGIFMVCLVGFQFSIGGVLFFVQIQYIIVYFMWGGQIYSKGKMIVCRVFVVYGYIFFLLWRFFGIVLRLEKYQSKRFFQRLFVYFMDVQNQLGRWGGEEGGKEGREKEGREGVQDVGC